MRQIASSVLHRSGAAAAWRHVFAPRGAVLMCHSIDDAPASGFDPNRRWRISAATLEMAVRCARDAGYHAATMDEVCTGLHPEGSRTPVFAVTFDDGYADNLHLALPLCRRLQVPITTYVTSGFIDRSHTAWWHLLGHLIGRHSALTLRLGDESCDFDCTTPAAKQRVFERIAAHLTQAPPAARTALIDEVDERYGDASRRYAQSLFLDRDQLCDFAADELVTIGVHGVSHSAMASLSTADAQSEMQHSRQFLHNVTGSAPQHLAYPYGSAGTTGSRDFELAREQGFASGVTTRHGCLTGRVDALALPRIPVFPDDTVSSMRCKLSGLTTMLARLRRRR